MRGASLWKGAAHVLSRGDDGGVVDDVGSDDVDAASISERTEVDDAGRASDGCNTGVLLLEPGWRIIHLRNGKDEGLHEE
jgi:hypothetical protein